MHCSYHLASSSVVNLRSLSSGLNHLFLKTKVFGYLLSRSFGLASLSVLENDNWGIEIMGFTDNVGLQSASGSPTDPRYSIGIFSRAGYPSKPFDVDKDTMSYENVEACNDKIKKIIKNVLVKRGWIWGSQNGFSIDLDQYKVIRILNEIFEESMDASVALYFFRWSECCIGTKHSVRAISRMINILVSGNMNYIAMDLLRHLVRGGNGEESSCYEILKSLFEMHTDRRALETIFSMLVRCCINEGQVYMSLKLIHQMDCFGIFPSRGVCISLLMEVLNSYGLELGWEFLEHMLSRGLRLNAAILSLFINRYCSEGHFDKGWELLMLMKCHGVRADIVAYTMFIDNLCKASFLKEATSILFKATHLGISQDAVSVSSLVDGYCNLGNPEEAIKIIDYFCLKPNIFVFSSFLSKLCAKGDMLKASTIFHEISNLGLFPDCVSYTTMISGYCKTGEIGKAFQYFGKLLKSGNPPSVTTYTVLIGACCKFMDLGDAAFVFQNMKSEGIMPDVITYNTLMNGYGKMGQLNKVFELMDMMRSVGVSPDVATYNILIHSMVARGFTNEAKGIIHELIRRGFAPDLFAFTDVISGFSRNGDFEEAFLLWVYMTDLRVKPDVMTCSALLHGYCRAHRMDEANTLFHKMLDAGLEPDRILYNTLIYGFCSIGDIEKACELVTMMVQKGIRPNSSTHEALVLGFEKKSFRHSVKHASMRLQEILLTNSAGINLDDCLGDSNKQ